MTLEVEQQLVDIKDENGKAQWQPTLRHTHATTLIENGTPVKTVQKD